MDNKILNELKKNYEEDVISESKVKKIIAEFSKVLYKDGFQNSGKYNALQNLYETEMGINRQRWAEVNVQMRQVNYYLGVLVGKYSQLTLLSENYFKGSRVSEVENVSNDATIFEIASSTVQREIEYATQMYEKYNALYEDALELYLEQIKKGVLELQYMYEAFTTLRRFKVQVQLHRVLIFITPIYLKFAYYLFGFYIALEFDIFSLFLMSIGVSETLVKPLIYILALITVDLIISAVMKKILKKLLLMILRELEICIINKHRVFYFLNLAGEGYPEIREFFKPQK